jgi:hypothetical protein
MKKLALTAAAVGVALLGIPALADTVQVTEMKVQSINAEPFLQTNTVVPVQCATIKETKVIKKESVLVPTTQPMVFVVNPSEYLLSYPNAIISVVRPDDLITRQAELNARILVEQAAGTISDTKANEFITRLGNVSANENALKLNGQLSWQEVERTYRSFDRIAHDLDNASTDRNHMVAGNFIVL